MKYRDSESLIQICLKVIMKDVCVAYYPVFGLSVNRRIKVVATFSSTKLPTYSPYLPHKYSLWYHYHFDMAVECFVFAAENYLGQVKGEIPWSHKQINPFYLWHLLYVLFNTDANRSEKV